MKTHQAIILVLASLAAIITSFLVGRNVDSFSEATTLSFLFIVSAMFLIPFLDKMVEKFGGAYTLNGFITIALSMTYLFAGWVLTALWCWPSEWLDPNLSFLRIGDTAFTIYLIATITLPFIYKFAFDWFSSKEKHQPTESD